MNAFHEGPSLGQTTPIPGDRNSESIYNVLCGLRHVAELRDTPARNNNGSRIHPSSFLVTFLQVLVSG